MGFSQNKKHYKLVLLKFVKLLSVAVVFVKRNESETIYTEKMFRHSNEKY